MRRVSRRSAHEAGSADSWTRSEVEGLLRIASRCEARFHPALVVLFSTGLRRGELLGLKWEDVDFERNRIHVRRALVRTGLTGPKSGNGRFVAMSPALGALLLGLLGLRRRQCLAAGWPEVPEWVFPSEVGSPWRPENFETVWLRLRRRANQAGIRPLKLHCTRHTWASMALAAGKSVRRVADQLGHASPALTLKTYAHALKDEEEDLSFAEFGPAAISGRLPASPGGESEVPNENALGVTYRGRSENLEHETGFEPATSTLATWCSTN